MHSGEVIEEAQIVEKELLAEVTVWMWQDLAVSIISNVTLLNMASQGVDVVQALLANEHCPTFEAHFTESLFMSSF